LPIISIEYELAKALLPPPPYPEPGLSRNAAPLLPCGSIAPYTNGTTSSTTSNAGRTSIALPPTTIPTFIPEKVTLPLSARYTKPLDLNTVERRGYPTESKETDYKPSRPHGLQEAPTFRPTEEEFRNPME